MMNETASKTALNEQNGKKRRSVISKNGGDILFEST